MFGSLGVYALQHDFWSPLSLNFLEIHSYLYSTHPMAIPPFSAIFKIVVYAFFNNNSLDFHFNIFLILRHV